MALGRRPRVSAWRQVLSFARPVVVLVVVPGGLTWLAGGPGGGVGTGLTWAVSCAAGWVLVVVGQAFFWWAEGTFIAHGQSLAPEDPPRVLVTTGPYRYCTSPMFFGVLGTLYGECLLLSPWLVVFAVVFSVWLFSWYLPYAEEPGLLLRFGGAWVEYSGRTFKGVLPVGLFSARFRYAGGRISENARTTAEPEQRDDRQQEQEDRDVVGDVAGRAAAGGDGEAVGGAQQGEGGRHQGDGPGPWQAG